MQPIKSVLPFCSALPIQYTHHYLIMSSSDNGAGRCRLDFEQYRTIKQYRTVHVNLLTFGSQGLDYTTS